MADNGPSRARGRGRAVLSLIRAVSTANLSQTLAARCTIETSSPKSITSNSSNASRSSNGTTNGATARGRGGVRPTSGILVTKPKVVSNKVGDKGRQFTVISNYFRLMHKTDLIINQYRVDFEPIIESSKVRRNLLRQKQEVFGCAYIFDGMSDLKTLNTLEDDELELIAYCDTGDEVIITLKYTNQIPWGCGEMLRMYNTQMRRNLSHLGYALLGRYYFDKKTEVKLEAYGGIGVWRGVLTAISQHDGGILMACDPITRVVRKQTAYELLRSIVGRVGPKLFQETARKELPGSVVMTRYNNRTYRVDDIIFNKNPQHSFEGRDGLQSTLIEYYKQQYNIEIRDENQPLLECLPSARDKRAGRTQSVLLIPELCLMTGLTAEMRNDYNLCKKLADVARLTPTSRNQNLLKFMNDLRSNDKVREEMSKWKLGFNTSLTEVTARQLDSEKIYVGDDRDGQNYNQNSGDFERIIRGRRMLNPVDIHRWALVCPKREEKLADEFTLVLLQITSPMGVAIAKPKKIVLENDRTASYLAALKSLPPNAEMIVCIVPNNNKERYDGIKKLCCCDKAVASQVVVSKTISRPDRLKSVCTKIALQMCVKLGGEIWCLKIPLNSVMVVGYDTYHDGALKGQSVGGFVSSLNRSLTRWFSKVSYHKSRDEMSGNFASNFKESLRRYREHNSILPDKVIIYRDGVGDGMIPHVFDYELQQMRKAMQELCPTNTPKLVFVIVTKRVNARIFRRINETQYENVPPGTIVDTVITRPERYDFYLVSQSVRQGTVAPTLYNIIEDESSLTPHQHQQFAYKMTHLYFNWPGTLRVPAPCLYASKLAYLTGTSLHREPATRLSNTLFYL